VGTKEPDCHGSRPILEGRHQSIVVALDVEDDPAGFQNARLWIGRLDILRIAPFGADDNAQPGIVLRPRGFDSSIASVVGKIVFDHGRADDDHYLYIARNSKIWKFQSELVSCGARWRLESEKCAFLDNPARSVS
jgi:hypothetical protein